MNVRVFIHAYSLRPQTLFLVVANTRTKSVQKQIKSIDVNKVGSNKRALTAAFRLACLEIRSRRRRIEGPNERYHIATSAFHCILSGSPNEAAYNTYSAGVMEIRIAGSSCRRPQFTLCDQIYLLIIILGCETAFLRIVNFGL